MEYKYNDIKEITLNLMTDEYLEYKKLKVENPKLAKTKYIHIYDNKDLSKLETRGEIKNYFNNRVFFEIEKDKEFEKRPINALKVYSADVIVEHFLNAF